MAFTLAALQRPPYSFVCCSATGFFGDGGDRELRELSRVGSGFRADVVQAW
jgi:NAD dependent epimerase/dehydratase family enzyme